MTKPIGIEDMTAEQIIKLILAVQKFFQKSFIRTGEDSTSIYFYNTKNSVNTYINIDNKLLAQYRISLQVLLLNPQSGS